MNKKFGFAYLLPVVAAAALTSKFTDTWFSYFLDFVKMFAVNLLILGVAYALGEALDDKVGERNTLGVILAIGIFALVFFLSAAYRQ